MQNLRRVIRRIIRESLLVEASCPGCGSQGAYVGMSAVECNNPSCKFFSAAQASLAPTLSVGGTQSHCSQCGTAGVDDPGSCATCAQGEPCPKCGQYNPSGTTDDCANCHGIDDDDDCVHCGGELNSRGVCDTCKFCDDCGEVLEPDGTCSGCTA